MLHLTDRGALRFGEYCRNVGFGVDRGGGWLWELLGHRPRFRKAWHHMDAHEFDILIVSSMLTPLK